MAHLRALLKRNIKPRALTGVLLILAGLLVGLLGNAVVFVGPEGAARPGAAIIHSLAAAAGDVVIVVGFIVLVWAVLRMITDSLAAR
jgi:hypothetical protein